MWSEHKGGPGNLYLIGDKARQRAEHIPRSAQLARKRSFCANTKIERSFFKRVFDGGLFSADCAPAGRFWWSGTLRCRLFPVRAPRLRSLARPTASPPARSPTPSLRYAHPDNLCLF